ncbi:MAG TPA: hypothetical protein VFO40_22090 [Chthoniobacterales bacterium]|nr:hypothetical protein [Chthoniobacterales bacterium]
MPIPHLMDEPSLSWDFTYDLAEMENPEEYPEYAGDDGDAQEPF